MSTTPKVQDTWYNWPHYIHNRHFLVVMPSHDVPDNMQGTSKANREVGIGNDLHPCLDRISKYMPNLFRSMNELFVERPYK